MVGDTDVRSGGPRPARKGKKLKKKEGGGQKPLTWSIVATEGNHVVRCEGRCHL